jgi:hypothetical protein
MTWLPSLFTVREVRDKIFSMKVLEDLAKLEEPGRSAPLPEPWAVLYVHPTKNGDRRNCRNCIMFSTEDGKCEIMDPSKTSVTPDHVCGYHVFGKPMKEFSARAGIQYVDPKTSGLSVVKGGTSCDVCKFFESGESGKGTCRGVIVKGKPATVEAKGCCARYQSS